MVTSQQKYHLRVFDLVGEEKAHRLNRLFPSINEIANQQKLIYGRRSSCDVKKSEHIIKLAMKVARYLDGALDFQERGLLFQNLLRLFNQPSDGFILKINVCAHFKV